MDSFEDAKSWLDFANADLSAAEQLDKDAFSYLWLICFHSQQAAEKTLKALLVHQAIEFPRTHSLSVLLDLLPAKIRDRLDYKGLTGLTVWAVEGRYPGDIAEVKPSEVKQALKVARAVFSVAETLIIQSSLDL